MNDNIMEFLNLADPDSEITEAHIDGEFRYITIIKKLTVKYCPTCQHRLYSK